MNLTNSSNENHSLLLTFAHRGEARAFLQEFKGQQVFPDFYQLNTPYEGLSVYLLLTGEGFNDSMATLSFALGRYPEISEVINYGVCGLLRRDCGLEVNDLVEVSTVYADAPYGEDKAMAFKSFTLKRERVPNRDLVSTHERVLSREKADYLDNFAPLVDRELWAQAYCAQKLGVKLSSFKVISDYADGEICQQVKEEAALWSDQMLRHFRESCDSPNLEYGQSSPSYLEVFLEGSKDFHITLSQERALERILQAHHIKGNDFSELKEKMNYQELLSEKKRPKDKTKDLILHLTNALNPLEAKLRRQLGTLTYGLEKLGAQVKHDQDLDKEKLHLSITLQGQEDFHRLAQALENFPYENWSKVLRGEDV